MTLFAREQQGDCSAGYRFYANKIAVIKHFF